MENNKVAVLLGDLLLKFRTFGEGLDGLREEMNNRFNHFEQKFNHLEQKLDSHIEQNRQEHQQLMQMIKELDKEVLLEIKRVK